MRARVAVGLAIGIPAAIGAGKLMTQQLFSVRPWDPVMLASATLALGLAALLASALPNERGRDDLSGMNLRCGMDVLRNVNPFRVISAAGGQRLSITRALDLQGGSFVCRFQQSSSPVTNLTNLSRNLTECRPRLVADADGADRRQTMLMVVRQSCYFADRQSISPVWPGLILWGNRFIARAAR
jgi:hypothetical protein